MIEDWFPSVPELFPDLLDIKEANEHRVQQFWIRVHRYEAVL